MFSPTAIVTALVALSAAAGHAAPLDTRSLAGDAPAAPADKFVVVHKRRMSDLIPTHPLAVGFESRTQPLSAKLQLKTGRDAVSLDHVDVDHASIVCKDVAPAGQKSVTINFKTAQSASFSATRWKPGILIFLPAEFSCSKVHAEIYELAAVPALSGQLTVTYSVVQQELFAYLGPWSLHVHREAAPAGDAATPGLAPAPPTAPGKASWLAHVKYFLNSLWSDKLSRTRIWNSGPLSLNLNYDAKLKKAASETTFSVPKALLGASTVPAPKVTCTNCYTTGALEITTVFGGVGKQVLTSEVYVNGSLLINVDMSVSVEQSWAKQASVPLFGVALQPYSIPGILDLGPMLKVSASTRATVTGAAAWKFGGKKVG